MASQRAQAQTSTAAEFIPPHAAAGNSNTNCRTSARFRRPRQDCLRFSVHPASSAQDLRPRKVCWSDGYGCLVPAGGVVAMRPLIVHASSKSLTDMPRLVLHMEYAADLVIADQLELALA